MAAMNDCIICSQMKKQRKSSVMCIGCQNRFCNDHHQEHRKSLQKDFDSLIEQHNIVRQNLYNESHTENSRMSQLLKKIDDWEKEMIQNIKTTALTTKNNLIHMISEEKNQLKQNFKSMADELQTNQSSSDFVETDIQQWQRQLNECKQKFEQLQASNNDFIDVEIKSVDWKNGINVNQKRNVNSKTANSVSVASPFKARETRFRSCLHCADRFSELLSYNNDFCSRECSDKFSSDDGSCFHGGCTISLANGLTKLVKDIRQGDVLQTPDGSAATVICIVKSLCKNKRASMVNFNEGLSITPWHPVRINNKWIFPRNVGNEIKIECEELYNFVLDVGHVINVNGIECVTLGHGFKGDVIDHPYYGTTKVLEDLRAIDNLNSGYVELLPNSIVRDKKTGLVCRIRQCGTTSHSEHFSNLNTEI